jgi:WD40 repeat protein
VLTDDLYGERKGHSGAVLKVKWADPEFGSVLASCGFDKQIIIWAEEESKDFQKKNWEWKMAVIQKEVVDIRFAPKQWGLTLAAASTTGSVNIYEGDPSNLTSW